MTPLQASIEHWKGNLLKAEKGTLTVEDIKARNCALCKAYVDEECSGCPVQIKTGKPDCTNTPWRDINVCIKEWINPTKHVQEMLSLLESCNDSV